MTRMLSEVIDTKSNNFDLLRLLAALAVMFGHSFWLQPAEGRHEPLLAFTGLEYSGSLAVYTFFLVSGILVTASYRRQQSWWRFIVLRLARIYPALFVCVLLSAFVVYPFISPKPFLSALTSHSVAHYFLINAQP